MKAKPTILVPVDLSDCAADVVERASTMAQTMDAQLILLHVAALPDGVDGTTRIHASDRDVSITAAEQLADASAAALQPYIDIASQRGVEAHAWVQLGDTTDQILAAEKRSAADYVVMGTHGRKGLARWVLGSVAEQVLRRARVPVVVVRSRHKPSCRARSCAWCPVTHGEGTQKVLAEAEG